MLPMQGALGLIPGQGTKWKSTPVFLPGESQGRGSLVGCCLWSRTESDTTEADLAAAAANQEYSGLILNSERVLEVLLILQT